MFAGFKRNKLGWARNLAQIWKREMLWDIGETEEGKRLSRRPRR
jgi:hypothetical protein